MFGLWTNQCGLTNWFSCKKSNKQIHYNFILACIAIVLVSVALHDQYSSTSKRWIR